KAWRRPPRAAPTSSRDRPHAPRNFANHLVASSKPMHCSLGLELIANQPGRARKKRYCALKQTRALRTLYKRCLLSFTSLLLGETRVRVQVAENPFFRTCSLKSSGPLSVAITAAVFIGAVSVLGWFHLKGVASMWMAVIQTRARARGGAPGILDHR